MDKNHLQNLGRILPKVARKAAAALTCIIERLLSWRITLFGKTASWLPENIWAAIIAVGRLLVIAVRL